MKKNVLYVFIAVVIIVVGFGMLFFLSKTEKENNLNKEIKLYINEKIKVEDLDISLLSISDSTCPEDEKVMCEWQGEYSYELLINGEKVTLGTVTARQYYYKGYVIVLSDNSSKDYIQFTFNKN